MENLRQFFMAHRMRIAAFFLVFSLLICSVTFLAEKYTNPQTYGKTIQLIDEKKATVLGVSAAIAGSATLLASIPDDATTPLAEEMMDLSSYLMAVVCVLVLEKSLLTVFGAAAFYLLIPVACILSLIFILNKRPLFVLWSIKLSILALAFLTIVPLSMKLGDYIYKVNQVSVDKEVNAIVEPITTENDETTPWYEKLWNKITDAVESTVDSAIDRGKKALNEYVDAVSIFLIAYCAIPVFDVFLFLWLLKFLFGINDTTTITDVKSKFSTYKKQKQLEEIT